MEIRIIYSCFTPPTAVRLKQRATVYQRWHFLGTDQRDVTGRSRLIGDHHFGLRLIPGNHIQLNFNTGFLRKSLINLPHLLLGGISAVGIDVGHHGQYLALIFIVLGRFFLFRSGTLVISGGFRSVSTSRQHGGDHAASQQQRHQFSLLHNVFPLFLGGFVFSDFIVYHRDPSKNKQIHPKISKIRLLLPYFYKYQYIFFRKGIKINAVLS